MKKVVLIVFLLVLFMPLLVLAEEPKYPDCNSNFCPDNLQWTTVECPKGYALNCADYDSKKHSSCQANCSRGDKVLNGCCIKSGFVPCGNPGQPACNLCHVFVMLKNFFDILIDYAALIAALFIAIGGVAYILSGGNEERAKTAKKIITSAIYGLLIVFCAWLIINTVMSLIGYAKFDIPDNPFSGKNWFEITGCP